MIFNEGGAKLIATTRIFILCSINMSLFWFRPDTMQHLFGSLLSDFEFGGSGHKLQKGGSKTFCRPLQQIMGRMSSNKNADIDLDSFLLDPDSSEGMKG